MASVWLDLGTDRPAAAKEGLTMERTMLSFNLPNIISITIMAALGYVILAAISQLFLNRQAAAPSALGGY